jgi:hypothetical protein
MIRIWLIVMAAGSPFTIRQMPSALNCRTVAAAIVEMSRGQADVRCVAARRDWR